MPISRLAQGAIAGLAGRRATLADEIERKHQDLRRMVADLDVLDATILLFDPDYQVESQQGKSYQTMANLLDRGDLTKLVLSVLRRATEPMSTRDLALEMLASMALDKNDRKLLSLMASRARGVLKTQKDAGVVQDDDGAGYYTLWRFVG